MPLNYDARILELASIGKYTNQQIADWVGVSEATVRRAKHRSASHLVSEVPVTLEQPITLENWDGVVTADWHVPLYSPFLVNQMIELAISLDLRELVIGGDLFNFDSLSQYDPKQNDAGLEFELVEANRLMETLGVTFDRIYIIWGNHDARLHKALGYKLQFETAMRMCLGDLSQEVMNKITISNLDHLWITQEDQKWRVCHPATYSRIPLSTPRTLATKYNSNVICAHAHHAAIGFAPNGTHVAVEIGGLFDAARTGYLQRTTTFPEWTPGYGWFQYGKFNLTTPMWKTT